MCFLALTLDPMCIYSISAVDPDCILPIPLPLKMKLLSSVGHYLQEAHSPLSSERHSINASYPAPCCTLI